MNSRQLVTAAFILMFASALSLAAKQDTAPTNKSGAPTQQVKPKDEGGRLFQQHCSRCHTAPDGFSPRISGTVVRHMRVRASLSQEEEKELLRFFNP
jgi:mono/diheme cytochrome c family protein